MSVIIHKKTEERHIEPYSRTFILDNPLLCITLLGIYFQKLTRRKVQYFPIQRTL